MASDDQQTLPSLCSTSPHLLDPVSSMTDPRQTGRVPLHPPSSPSTLEPLRPCSECLSIHALLSVLAPPPLQILPHRQRFSHNLPTIPFSSSPSGAETVTSFSMSPRQRSSSLKRAIDSPPLYWCTSFNSQRVEMVDSFKYLCIILNNKLSFDHPSQTSINTAN